MHATADVVACEGGNGWTVSCVTRESIENSSPVPKPSLRRASCLLRYPEPKRGSKPVTTPRSARADSPTRRLADADGRAGSQTALTAVRRRFRVEVGRITTPRAGARTAGQTSCTLRLGWM